MSIKNFVKKCPIYKYTIGSSFANELHILKVEKQRFCREAKSRFATEGSGKGNFEDYKRAFWRHRVTFSEYMYSYEFWRLDESQRDEFVSTSEMQCIYRKLGNPQVREIFHDKAKFLTLFTEFVHRDWALAKNMTAEEFRAMVMRKDCIAKPIDGTRGDGIFKIRANEVDDWEKLYVRCKKENILLEECIEECKELACFHPVSLNTIRVVTISGKGKCKVFGALFRMGAHGSIVDNTHAGGIYAPINVETGTIDVAAIDGHNNKYDQHPDTHLQIKGFQIPFWSQIVEACESATRTIPDIRFAGWDVCVNKAGQVEIIEGNHAPDFDGGMQAPLKIGVKRKLAHTVQEVMGINPLPYISIFKNP